jgi:hypothetical protein
MNAIEGSRVTHAILFADPNHGTELFTDRESALKTFEARKENWSCHLFERVDDCALQQPVSDEELEKLLNEVVSGFAGDIRYNGSWAYIAESLGPNERHPSRSIKILRDVLRKLRDRSQPSSELRRAVEVEEVAAILDSDDDFPASRRYCKDLAAKLRAAL